MTRISMAQLQELSRRGRISQVEVDRIAESQRTGHKARQAIADQAVEEIRFDLTAPVEFTVPIELWTENRLRAMHPKARGCHVKAQRAIVRAAWMLHFRGGTPRLPVTVLFTRFGRHMDGHDSLAAAFKHVTDEVTELLGLRNDDTEEVSWIYDQTPRGLEAMKISIRISPR